MGVVLLSDAEIGDLVAEQKQLPVDYRTRLALRPPKRAHQERELTVIGATGSEFLILIRQSIHNPLDFSVILGYRSPSVPHLFRLRRYNGRNHEHKNLIEGEVFYDFHVHQATERYQRLGMAEEAFALPTDRYSDREGALQAMVADCGFVTSSDAQMSLFWQ